MQIYFIFLFINFLIFLFGSSISSLLFKNKTKLFDLSIYCYSLPIGLFFIGNLTFVLNFFFKINIFIYLLYLFFICLNLKNLNLKLFRNNISQLLVIPSILWISFFDINLSYDAGLYHLQFQNWLKNFKIITGFYNINPRFGFSSIFEYISVNFYSNDNLIYLHFVNLFFLIFFFNLIYQFVVNLEKYKYLATFIVIFLFMDNFGFNGGKNGFIEIEPISNFDSPFGIIFFFSNFLILSSYRRNLNKEEHLLVNIFILFTIQLRIFGLILIFPYLIIFAFKKLKIQPIILILSIFWLIKNVLHSACLFYPITFTCLPNLTWVNKYKGDPHLMKEDIRNFHSSISNFENINNWFNDWMLKSENNIVLKNLLISYILIYIFKKTFFQVKNNNLIAYFSIILYYFFWLFNAPSIRFGQGIFISTLFLFSDNIVGLKPVFKEYKKTILSFTLFLGIFGFLMFPRLSMYINVNFLSTPVIVAPQPNLLKSNQNLKFKQLAEAEDQCWETLYCSGSDIKEIAIRRVKFNYLIIEFNNK